MDTRLFRDAGVGELLLLCEIIPDNLLLEEKFIAAFLDGVVE